jgi:hypothetical protein
LQYRKVGVHVLFCDSGTREKVSKTLWESALSHFVFMCTVFMEHSYSREVDNALACQEMFLPMKPKALLPSSQKPKPILIKLIPVRKVVH